MSTASKNSTKWIVIGSIVFVLALLIAVGPILFSKYMRAKWENRPNYKVSNVLMNVSGQLCISKDNIFYLKGDNNLYYVLENINQDINDKIGQNCNVLGKMRVAKNNETIDQNPVRLFVGVTRITFKDSTIYNEKNMEQNNDIEIGLKNKIEKKAKLKVETNMRLNKHIMFDVIKGNVKTIERIDNKGEKYVAVVLTDEFGDNYMLYKKGTDLSKLENNKVVCLGREILPPTNMPLIVDESTFEIYEIYDADYNKLI